MRIIKNKIFNDTLYQYYKKINELINMAKKRKKMVNQSTTMKLIQD